MSALSSSTDSSPEGVAFTCDAAGAIRGVALSTLVDGTLEGTLFGCLDSTSLNACTIFLSSVVTSGYARSMPLRLGGRSMHCFGFAPDDTLRVVAVIDPLQGAALADEAVRESGDAAFQTLGDEIRRTHSVYDLYEELARLNNELVTAQREQARANAELRRVNEYKNELLGIAAHDLRNPLSANGAFIDFLLDGSEGFTEENLLLLDRLRKNNRFMRRLVEDILDFSAIESGHVRLRLQESDLAQVVGGVVATMRIVAERKSVDVGFTIDPDVPPLPVDRIKLMQAVQNLIANAVSYSPAGATVDVRIVREDGFVRIEVEDRGPGIPPDEQADLFKPFVRLSTARTGSSDRSVGLGLAITKRMVEAHGGTITVDSEVGRGSTFVIRLPVR